MQTNTIGLTFIKACLAGFAERLAGAPGAGRLAELATTANAGPHDGA